MCSPCYCFKPEMRKVLRGRAGCPDTGAEGEPAKTPDRRRCQRSAGRKALPCWLSRPDCRRAEGREGDQARAEGPRGRADLPCRCAAALRSMRATNGSKRQGWEYGQCVSVFLSSWAAATSCSTGLLGYIFETFNKLTYCIITHVYVYWCLSQKSWVFLGI